MNERSAHRRGRYLQDTKQMRQTSMPSGGIRICDPSNQAAANLHLRPHSYQDQQKVLLGLCNFVFVRMRGKS